LCTAPYKRYLSADERAKERKKSQMQAVSRGSAGFTAYAQRFDSWRSRASSAMKRSSLGRYLLLRIMRELPRAVRRNSEPDGVVFRRYARCERSTIRFFVAADESWHFPESVAVLARQEPIFV
jgi:hypothetical protein